MDKISFLNLKKHNEELFDEIFDEIRKVCKNTSFILGPAVEEFENNFAKYCGVKYAVAVNSGTAALQLAILAAGIKEGDEVITTPYTFFATIESILYCGAKPVFVDIDTETFNIDIEKIEEKITSKTKAILPVHLYGQPAEMDKINELAEKYNLKVIEDACQAHGAEYKYRKVGSIGDAGCFSFYPTKNLSCWGEGGIITTNSEEIAKEAKKLRSHGSDIRYVHEEIGYNERMDGIQGAVLDVKLKHLDRWNEARRKYAKLYNELLKDLPLETPKNPDYLKHVYHLYTIKLERRDELKKFLESRGVDTAIHYTIPLHLQKACENLGYTEGSLPVAEEVSKKVLSLPLYPEIGEEKIKKVVELIKEFYGRSN